MLTLTSKQEQALSVIIEHDNVLAYGGSRSGKTFLICYFFIFLALRFTGIRLIIARLFATDIRGAVWSETLPAVARLLGLVAGEDYTTNEQFMEMKFANGAIIICAGLDDKERVDKILGREFAGIYLNESQDIPWATVKTIKTRLSQNIPGHKNKFIVDLNPTTTDHWTYKLWFLGTIPETKTPVSGDYAAIQMNPVDNAINLAPGYIEQNLMTLTGRFRARFYDGEYSNESALRVFNPASVYNQQQLDEWYNTNIHGIRLVGGLDLGWGDCDAFIVLGYIEGEPDIWLIHEHKTRRQNISELAETIKMAISELGQRFPRAIGDFSIWCDSADLMYKSGAGAASMKSWRELADNFDLPVRPAYKRAKAFGIDFLKDDVDAGRLHIPIAGSFAEECEKTVWQYDVESEQVIRIIDDKIYHPDEMDAILYAYRWLMKYGNSAMMGRAQEKPAPAQPSNYLQDALAILGEDRRYW